MSEQKMLSIWFFVGVMLTLLGVIITVKGVDYLFHPEKITTEMAKANPDIWWGARNPNVLWGAIMLVAGLAFLLPSIKKHRSSNTA